MLETTVAHLLTGNELNAEALHKILSSAAAMKSDPALHQSLLQGKHIALIFEKPSLRTRFSFTVAVHQLGGQCIESAGGNRKNETPEDFIRVIQGYCAGMMIRTHDDTLLAAMASHARIPIINGLTGRFHPCQVLADLLTLQERFGTLNGLKLCYIGDGNNILHSLIIMATKLGITIRYFCPGGHGPHPDVVHTVGTNGCADKVQAFGDPESAVRGCHGIYTDVWTSMGFEARDESMFHRCQVDASLMAHAEEDAVFMHCMPMERGKEVSETLPDAPCSVIFRQSENRLHAQKALLVHLFA